MEQLTNNIRKLIHSLGEAKNRRATGLFKAEGTKCVLDTIGHFRVRYVVATERWYATHRIDAGEGEMLQAPSRDMERMSSLSTAPEVIAVYEIPEKKLDVEALGMQLVLALDRIQDPGNLGTIIRTADWFGIRNVVCARSTADIFNPKTVQATMGAISRVAVHYCDLSEVLGQLRQRGMAVYSTELKGENVYTAPLSAVGVILFGNEGQGVSDEAASLATHHLLIPSYPPGEPTSESLNVASAAAIIISEFRKRQIV